MSATVAHMAVRCFLPKEEPLHDAIGSYVDDFWAFAKPAHLAWLLLWALLSAFWYLGLAVSLKKLQWPAQQMKILSFIFDLLSQTVQVPAKKFAKAKEAAPVGFGFANDLSKGYGVLAGAFAIGFRPWHSHESDDAIILCRSGVLSDGGSRTNEVTFLYNNRSGGGTQSTSWIGGRTITYWGSTIEQSSM